MRPSCVQAENALESRCGRDIRRMAGTARGRWRGLAAMVERQRRSPHPLPRGRRVSVGGRDSLVHRPNAVDLVVSGTARARVEVRDLAWAFHPIAPLHLDLNGGDDVIVRLNSQAPAVTQPTIRGHWQLRSETSRFVVPTASGARFVASPDSGVLWVVAAHPARGRTQ